VIPARLRARGRRRALAIAVILVLAAAAVLIYRGRQQPGATSYRVARVERRSIARLVEAAGKLDVLTRVEIFAPETGRITEVLVRSGDRVTRGQPLARMDQRATSIAVQSAQAGVRAAQSRIGEASAEVAAATDARKRLEGLLGRGLASPSEITQAEAMEKKAKASLEVARADRAASAQGLKSAELAQSLAALLSPMDGVVLRAPDTPASSAERTPLFVVGSPLESLRVDADVAESEIGLVRRGQAARFGVPAFPGRQFDATVESIAIDAERTGVAVRYRVQLRCENPEGVLLPGMTATARIEVARADDVLATREAALRFVPEQAEPAPPRSRVFRVRSDKLEPVRISAGLSDGAFTEIRPEPQGALAVGSELAVGVGTADAQTRTGPGIKLGNR
jgi:HlyD family secretion protein